jgi:hypothetical protein
VTTHFTGGYFYRDDLVENEKLYSIRNFILLSRKFFGKQGEERAISMLENFPDKEIVAVSIQDVKENFQGFHPLKDISLKKFPQIKVTGINQFHEILP